MKRLETRGREIGTCNLCGAHARLTDDHIPPKGVPLVGQAYLERLTDAMGLRQDQRSRRLFQRGVKYRSLCAQCNNERLGIHYDPILVAACRQVHTTLTQQVHLPMVLPVQLNRLMRAFIGHLQAHGLDRYGRGELSVSFSDYFLDERARFPAHLRAYAWVYPYKAQVVAHALGGIFDHRDILIQGTSEPFIYSLVKFYPLGFLCSTTDLPEEQAHRVTRVDHLTTGTLDDTVHVPLGLSNAPRADWPEAPGRRGAVFHNALGTLARPV